MREIVRKGCEFQDGLPLSPSGRELHVGVAHLSVSPVFGYS